MRKKIFRQFESNMYRRYNLLLVLNDGDHRSQTTAHTDLFGWGDETFLRHYTSRFKLELVYG